MMQRIHATLRLGLSVQHLALLWLSLLFIGMGLNWRYPEIHDEVLNVHWESMTRSSFFFLLFLLVTLPPSPLPPPCPQVVLLLLCCLTADADSDGRLTGSNSIWPLTNASTTRALSLSRMCCYSGPQHSINTSLIIIAPLMMTKLVLPFFFCLQCSCVHSRSRRRKNDSIILKGGEKKDLSADIYCVCFLVRQSFFLLYPWWEWGKQATHISCVLRYHIFLFLFTLNYLIDFIFRFLQLTSTNANGILPLLLLLLLVLSSKAAGFTRSRQRDSRGSSTGAPWNSSHRLDTLGRSYHNSLLFLPYAFSLRLYFVHVTPGSNCELLGWCETKRRPNVSIALDPNVLLFSQSCKPSAGLISSVSFLHWFSFPQYCWLVLVPPF